MSENLFSNEIFLHIGSILNDRSFEDCCEIYYKFRDHDGNEQLTAILQGSERNSALIVRVLCVNSA